MNPSSVQGGSPSTGTVTLSGPAPVGGALVSLSSDNTSAATVPASVTVAAGASSATFAVTTSAVSGSTAVTISALYGGVTRTAPLTVTPLAALSSLQVNPSSVKGGSPSTGTVTLTRSCAFGGCGRVVVKQQHIGGERSGECHRAERCHQRHVYDYDESGIPQQIRDHLGQLSWRQQE